MSLNGVVGPFVIGTVVDCFLLGVVGLQIKTYFSNFPRDNKFFKYSVIILAVLSVFHTVMSIRDLYDTAVIHFGDLEYLAKGPLGFLCDCMVTGVMAFIVQCFYGWRIFIMSGRKMVLPIVLVAMATISLIFSILTPVRGFQLVYFALYQQTTYTVILWLGFAALTDVLVTIFLVYYLRGAQKGATFEPTRSFLTKIIANTIENNLLTSLVACVDAVLFGVSSTAWHVAPNLTLGKLYFISFLVSLNSRGGLAHAVSEERGSEGLHPFGTKLNAGAGGGLGGTYPSLAIKVTLDTAQAEAFGEVEPERRAKGRHPAPHSPTTDIQELDEVKLSDNDNRV